MKKYFNYLLVLPIVFIFVAGTFLLKTASADTNTCTKDTVYNSDGTPCSLIASCPPGALFDFRTGQACSGLKSDNDFPHDYYADYLVETLKIAKRGTKSVDVANLQAFLIANNFLDIKYGTTYYGPITTEALKSFQINSGLKVDGRMGPEVLKTMKEVIGRTPTTARNIGTMAKTFSSNKNNFKRNSAPVEFTKGLDLNQESSWGLAVAKNTKGEGIIYVRDFGLDPKNGKLNTMTTFVDRFE